MAYPYQNSMQQATPYGAPPSYYPPQQQMGYPMGPVQPMYQPGYSAPVVVQPGALSYGQPGPGGLNWMVRPAPIPGCPPGLEFLTTVDRLFIQQQVEMLEFFTGWETCNKYRVLNSLGHQCYFAFEESDFCSRQCCGAAREFTMHIVDNANQEVIRAYRPFKCAPYGCFGCCHACQFEIQIEASGSPIGFAIQNCYVCSPSFTVMDQRRQPVFTIQGPNCVLCPRCPCEYNFRVLNYSTNQEIGRITKQWSGFVQEAFTDADNFGISFPQDLDVHMKATLLGVLFLIDFMYFEDSPNNNRR